MAICEEFWRGRRVFVTGHTGFKGGWLSLWLARMGASVTGYSLPPRPGPGLFEAAGVGEQVTSIMGDIRECETLADAMREADPEIVFHLAAQPIVRTSYDDPVETYMTNVMGTVHMFEAARTCPDLRVFVNVTSDKCYENPEWFWGCREHDPMGGHDPYSSSKGCAELVTAAYRRSFFARPETRHVAVASGRAGNVIGGGDWAADRLIPDVVRAVSVGKSTVIRNPDSVRPWQHVLEPVSGYLQLSEALWREPEKFEGGWNFGPVSQDALPVRAVLDRFCAMLGHNARWHVERNEANPHEAHLLQLDITKAQRVLGWSPSWNLDQSLKATAEWYSAAFANEDMAARTQEQIASYHGCHAR